MANPTPLGDTYTITEYRNPDHSVWPSIWVVLDGRGSVACVEASYETAERGLLVLVGTIRSSNDRIIHATPIQRKE